MIKDPLEREICQPCPIGADCSEAGMSIENVSAVPGYWRANATTTEFTDCSLSFAGANGKQLAMERCCPIDPITNISICKSLITNGEPRTKKK